MGINYYQKNKSSYQASSKKYRFNNPKKMLEISRSPRIKLIEMLGGHCVKCQYAYDIRALQIDHINGNGRKEARKHGTSSMYYFYLRNPQIAFKKIQVLCANCNQIKRHENKEACLGDLDG